MNNPNYKNGIKTLTKQQMITGLPAYTTMIEKIRQIRRETAAINKEYLARNSFEAMKYDQIFSLLGGRGAGKTSMLLTIYNDLLEDEANIMLPIIMPELLDKDEDILSWLLSAMKTNLESIENGIANIGYNKGSDEYKHMLTKYNFFERCVFSQKNELREKYNKLRNTYYTKDYNYAGDNYTETRDWKASSVDSSFRLMQMFIEYWNCLIDVYSNCINDNKANEADRQDPLIFIFIDDADLKPQIFNELLFVIPKYLSHPNVIVFVSASPKTLSYAVKNYMYHSITLNAFDMASLMEIEHRYNAEGYTNHDGNIIRFKELRYGREYDKIVKLSDEILKKLFPVYNRLYLKKYDKYEDKGLLQMFRNDSAECEESIPFSEKVAKILNNFSSEIHKMHYDRIPRGSTYKHKAAVETLERKKKSFKLLTDGRIDNIFYLSFVGQYPRDITSVYFALKDMLVELLTILENLYNNNNKTSENLPSSFLDAVYESIKKFINAVIMCNGKLNMFSGKVDNLFKKQLLHWQMYVNYTEVLDTFRKPEYFSQNKKEPDAFVEMMSLLNFTEQIIVLVMPQRKTVHGEKEFRELLDLMNISIIKQTNDLDYMFRQYYAFHTLGIIPTFHIDRIGDRDQFINAADNLKIYRNDKNDMKTNKKWYDLYAKVIVKKNYLIGHISEYRSELLILPRYNFLDNDYDSLVNNYYSELKDVFIKGRVSGYDEKAAMEMDDLILMLDGYIGQLNLCAKPGSDMKQKSNDKLRKDLMSSMDPYILPGFTPASDEMFSLIEYIINNRVFSRDYLVSTLQSIRNSIDEQNDLGSSMLMRYINFENLLKQQIKIYENMEVYSQYKSTIERIKKTYKNYIARYAHEIYNKIAREHNVEFSGLLSFETGYPSLSFNIEIAKEHEWNEVLKMVDNLEKK